MNETMTVEMASLLKDCAHENIAVAIPAQDKLTKALAEEFYKQGNLDGDLVSGLFESEQLDEDIPAEYLLDMVVPGTERELIAFYIPDTGHIPERTVNMNKVIVPTISVGNSINCPLKFLRQKRIAIVGRMMEVYEAGYVMKDNIDAFTVIMRAGIQNGANTEASATDGVFDFASIRAMKLGMRRNQGGNSTSVNRNKLTDMYLSPEAAEDLRSLTADAADDFTRKKITDLADMDGFWYQGVVFHVIDELGASQLFQNIFTGALSGTLTDSSTELMIGLDLTKRGKRNFVNPKRRGHEMFADPQLHRRQEWGVYGWKERGWAVLSSKPVILGNA